MTDPTMPPQEITTEHRHPTPRGVEKALELIRPYMPETPLIRAEILSSALKADVWLKNETASPIGSFKLRGAFNDLIHATTRQSLRGAVTASSGNLGQAVALAARTLGLGADVFVAEATNQLKTSMIEAYGATVHKVGADIDVARDAAIEFTEANGSYFVYDGMSFDVMEGAATMALEITRQLPDIDYLIIPLGGGSLAAGSAAVMRALQPGAKTVGVQPAQAPVFAESFHARRPLERPGESVADSLVSRQTVDYALRMLWEYLDDAWVVSEEGILAATHMIIESAHILVEPSGAVALAAAWDRRQELRGKRIVLALTGATVTDAQLRLALATPPFAAIGKAVQ